MQPKLFQPFSQTVARYSLQTFLNHSRIHQYALCIDNGSSTSASDHCCTTSTFQNYTHAFYYFHNHIETMCNNGKLEEATEELKRAMHTSFVPTIYTCNFVMGALLRHKRYESVLNLYRAVTVAAITL